MLVRRSSLDKYFTWLRVRVKNVSHLDRNKSRILRRRLLVMTWFLYLSGTIIWLVVALYDRKMSFGLALAIVAAATYTLMAVILSLRYSRYLEKSVHTNSRRDSDFE